MRIHRACTDPRPRKSPAPAPRRRHLRWRGGVGGRQRWPLSGCPTPCYAAGITVDRDSTLTALACSTTRLEGDRGGLLDWVMGVHSGASSSPPSLMMMSLKRYSHAFFQISNFKKSLFSLIESEQRVCRPLCAGSLVKTLRTTTANVSENSLAGSEIQQ